jgi:tetratricopeptide (TPR) repeat protein
MLPWIALLLWPALASAQENGAATPPHADEYTVTVQRGITQLAGGDPSGAIATFQQAVQLDGSRPEAPYYIATAQRMSGDLQTALTGFQQAAALAQAANLPRWRARALEAAAFTLERMEGRVEDARTAWQEYARFADTNPTVADPQLGRARVSAIDIMNEQETAYVNVRQRIAEREQERAREAEEASQPRRRH